MLRAFEIITLLLVFAASMTYLLDLIFGKNYFFKEAVTATVVGNGNSVNQSHSIAGGDIIGGDYHGKTKPARCAHCGALQ